MTKMRSDDYLDNFYALSFLAPNDYRPYYILMHHGIKGQHWGVRNGPPYPLDAKTSAKIKKGKNEKVRFTDKEIQYKKKTS